MSKKIILSTAILGLLTTTGILSNIYPVKADILSQDEGMGNKQFESSKDTTVASVMDNNGAPFDVNEAKSIEQNESNNSVLPADTVRSITQSKSLTQGVSTNQQNTFINKIGPIAQQVASKYNIYASVSMAQSIVESTWGTSTLSTEYNNYFGVKGSYHGSTISFPTKEWSAEKGYYTIYDYFRSYPSIYDSYADNAYLLRNGVSGAPDLYRGTWKENTSSYKDATAWLQGRYATSPIYASTLNNIIKMYNLTQYDTQSVTDGSSNNSINGMKVSMNDTATVTNKNSAKIYINADKNQALPNRVLAYNTPWHVSSKITTSDGIIYYQVASKEYVKASDVQLKSEGNTSNTSIYDDAIISKKNGSVVYSRPNTDSTTKRILPFESSWITTARFVNSKGETFYFVGNDSYILGNDVNLKSSSNNNDYKNDNILYYPKVIHITANPAAKIYDDKHNVSALSLTKGTDWKVNSKSIHSDGTAWYHVATNQWISANDADVQNSNTVINDVNTIKINYIPGYAVNTYSTASNNQFTGVRVANGTIWRVISKENVNGQLWYKTNLGWINGNYCSYIEN